MIVALFILPFPSHIKLGQSNANENGKFYHHWKLHSLARCKKYSIISAFSPCKFGSWTACSPNQYSGGHHIMISAYSATGRSKFFVLICCGFSWIKTEAAVSAKQNDTENKWEKEQACPNSSKLHPPSVWNVSREIPGAWPAQNYGIALKNPTN